MRIVSNHGKTLIQRNQAQERLWFAQGYFLKITRETINVLQWGLFIIFLNEHLLEAVVRRCSVEKVILKFHKIYSKKHVPAACIFI